VERESNMRELGHNLPESDYFPEAMSGASQSTTMKKNAKQSNSKSSTKSKHKKMTTQTAQEDKTSKQTEIAQAECNELNKGTDDQTLKPTEESQTQAEESRTQVVCDEVGKESHDQVLENSDKAKVECNQKDKSTDKSTEGSIELRKFHFDPRLGNYFGPLELYTDEIGLLKRHTDDGNNVADLGSSMVDYLVSVALKGTELEQPDVLIGTSSLYKTFQLSCEDPGPWKAYDDRQYRLLVPICYCNHYVLLDVLFDFNGNDSSQYFKSVEIHDSDLPVLQNNYINFLYSQQPTATENDTDYDENDFDEGDTDKELRSESGKESETEELEPPKPKNNSKPATKIAKTPKPATKITTKRKVDCRTTTGRPKSAKKIRGGRGKRGPTENSDICEENNSGGDKKDKEELYDVKPMLKVVQKGLALTAVSKETVKEELLSKPDLIVKGHEFKPLPQQKHNDCSMFAIGALLHLWFNEPIQCNSYTQKGMTAMRRALYRRWKNKETRDSLTASHILHFFPYLRKYKNTFAGK